MRVRPEWAGALLMLVACGGKEAGSPSKAETGSPDIVVLDSAQLAAAGLALGTVARLPADTIALTGTITFDAARVSHVGPRTQGRIRQVLVDIGDRVSAGQTLTILDSPEVGAAQSRWVQALVSRQVAARNADRAERLFREGIVSERRRLEAEAELRDREAQLAAALQALSAVGAEPDSEATGVFVLRSPFAGVVVEKHATVGEVVNAESDLFLIGNLSRVWLLLDLYETDLPRLREAAPALVQVDAVPDRVFRARVVTISTIVDSVSRSVKVRIEIPNPDLLLKPGMFARAALAVTGEAVQVGVLREAVQELNGRQVVFVPAGPGRFQARSVTLGHERAGTMVEIRSGVAERDTVVFKGAFALKAHLLRPAEGHQ